MVDDLIADVGPALYERVDLRLRRTNKLKLSKSKIT